MRRQVIFNTYLLIEERLNEVLSHWGVMSSKIMEEVFHDPCDKEGSNRTGIYTAKMTLHQKIREWLPLDGTFKWKNPPSVAFGFVRHLQGEM